MYFIKLLSMMAFAYLLGSVCTAILVCKLFKLPDPRTSGSNNPGATNVMRIGGKVPAFLTFLGDGLKGFIPSYLAFMISGDIITVQLVMLSAILGHIFPVFFNFKGGKAVATTIGSLFAFNYLIALLFVTIWGLTFYASKVSALGALVAAAFLPFLGYIIYQNKIVALLLFMITVIIVLSHKENIKRLLNKQENTFNK